MLIFRPIVRRSPSRRPRPPPSERCLRRRRRGTVPASCRLSSASTIRLEDDDDLGDEEDLSIAQPLADEESSFDDFDDEFDDDFEEEANDPDWDHPDDAERGATASERTWQEEVATPDGRSVPGLDTPQPRTSRPNGSAG